MAIFYPRSTNKETFLSEKTIFALLFIFFITGLFNCFLISGETENSKPDVKLKFETISQDSELGYVIQVSPLPNSKLLFTWTIGIKELSTGEFVLIQSARTMRGQENEYYRKYLPDGSYIQIKFTIHKKLPKLLFNIKRTRGGQLVYSSEGESNLKLTSE